MNTRSKIVSAATLKKRIARHRRGGKKISFTNGCFDILHAGHVSYLETAKRPGQILVVGLNSDRSVRRIKGAGRPVVKEKDRARVLAALECVDYVVRFDEDTPLALMEKLRPDVIIKGADWKNKGAVGTDLVRSYGGRVRFIKFVPGRSTTGMIKRIARRGKR